MQLKNSVFTWVAPLGGIHRLSGRLGLAAWPVRCWFSLRSVAASTTLHSTAHPTLGEHKAGRRVDHGYFTDAASVRVTCDYRLFWCSQGACVTYPDLWRDCVHTSGCKKSLLSVVAARCVQPGYSCCSQMCACNHATDQQQGTAAAVEPPTVCWSHTG